MAQPNRSRPALAAAFLVTLVLGTPAHAQIVGWEFSGTISSPFDDTGLLDPSIVAGAAFSGRVIYDAAMMPSSSTSVFARYTYASPPFTFEVTVGEVTFTAVDTYVFDVRGPLHSSPSYTITQDTSGVPQPVPGAPTLVFDNMLIDFGDSTAENIPDNAPPTAAPELSDFDYSSFGMNGCLATEVGTDTCSSVTWSFVGDVTALPEPAGSPLAAAALGGVALLAGRRRARRARSMRLTPQLAASKGDTHE